MRADPWDRDASQVLADAWLAEQDPRGAWLTLIHAADDATPEEALDLSERAVELLDREYERIWGQPGGYPFRDSWRGRRFVARAAPMTKHLSNRLGPDKVFGRIVGFLRRFTDCRGPEEMKMPYGNEALAMESLQSRGHLGIPTHGARAAALRALHDLFGHGVWSIDGRWRRHEDVDVLDRLESFFARKHRIALTMEFRFALTWPDSDVVLPWQHPSLYALDLRNELRLDLGRNGVTLSVAWPFQGKTAAFTRYRAEVRRELGDLLAPDDALRVFPR